MEVNPFNLAVEVLRQANKVLVLTGAGISVASPANIPCFTGQGSGPPLDIETRKQIFEQASPTLAHKILAKWEILFPEFLLITQNIDNLHHRAGSRLLLEFHGNYKTHIVGFNELIDNVSYLHSLRFAGTCDVCLVIGTANNVYPANHIPEAARINGAAVIFINLEENVSMSDSIFLQGVADDMLEKLDKQLYR